MAIPDFQSTMLPFLENLKDGKEVAFRDVVEKLANQYCLTQEERETLLPSKTGSLFNNRIAWAKTHLKFAGLIENPSRGKIKISALGAKTLLEMPPVINCKYLKKFPSYLKFIGTSNEVEPSAEVAILDSSIKTNQTPMETIDSAHAALTNATRQDMLERIKKCSPAFFEIVVIRFLQALGYGATGHALVTGKAGDGGIDGIIREDKLGLDIVCVQAKRWEGTVGRPTIQTFVGSMDFVRARKGVVITTGFFTRDAIDYIDRGIDGKRVVLIDGPTLANYMIDYGIGVTVTKKYEIQEISEDFFNEDA